MNQSSKKFVLGVSVLVGLISPVFAATGSFAGPLAGALLSVDVNGGNISANNATTEGWGASGPLAPDNYGVTWTPWGGPAGTGGDGTQLPSGQSSPLVSSSSITKTFGSITATLSIDVAHNSSAYNTTVNGAVSMDSRDRGTGNGTWYTAANDGDLFRDLVYAGGGFRQSANYLMLGFSGLAAGSNYTIAVYGFDPTGSHSMNWTATAPNASAYSNGGNPITGWGSGNGSFTAPADEQTITWVGSPAATPAPAVFNLVADGTGKIKLYGWGGSGASNDQNASTSYLNAFQIKGASGGGGGGGTNTLVLLPVADSTINAGTYLTVTNVATYQ